MSTTRAGLAAAAVLASGLALAPTSQPAAAIPVSPFTTFPERDEVLIEEVGYFVGGDGFTAGAPDNPAVLTWQHSGTFGTAPELDGKVHFDGAEHCARVILIALDNVGNELTDGRTTSDVMCPATEGHHARNIRSGGVGPLEAHFGAAQVRVLLQTEPRPGEWVNAGSQTVVFGPDLDSDTAQISRAEFDLGSGPFAQGAPTGSATVEWIAEENEQISVHLDGTLYAREADDSCVQVEVRYKDGDGDVIETRRGDEHCLDTDELTTFPVHNGSGFSSYALRQVTYALLKDGVQMGAVTVELGDPLIPQDLPVEQP
ncbi:MAG: hypothetical protein ABWZ99_00080 [Ilumatobacteraceae bacterium]